jgi:hypothetical protein
MLTKTVEGPLEMGAGGPSISTKSSKSFFVEAVGQGQICYQYSSLRQDDSENILQAEVFFSDDGFFLQ